MVACLLSPEHFSPHLPPLVGCMMSSMEGHKTLSWQPDPGTTEHPTLSGSPGLWRGLQVVFLIETEGTKYEEVGSAAFLSRGEARTEKGKTVLPRGSNGERRPRNCSYHHEVQMLRLWQGPEVRIGETKRKLEEPRECEKNVFWISTLFYEGSQVQVAGIKKP